MQENIDDYDKLTPSTKGLLEESGFSLYRELPTMDVLDRALDDLSLPPESVWSYKTLRRMLVLHIESKGGKECSESMFCRWLKEADTLKRLEKLGPGRYQILHPA